MNDEQASQIVRECMSDERPMEVHITVKDAWLLISALQLAVRHPELSVYMKDNLFSTARQFQTAIEAIHAEAHELLELGWDTRFDGVDSLDDVIVIPLDEKDVGIFDFIDDYDEDGEVFDDDDWENEDF